MAATIRIGPSNVSLAAGVRAPTALVKNGIQTYLNLDPEGIANDVAYEADALPASATPAWTKQGTQAESVASSILNLADTSGADHIYYTRSEAGLATGSSAYLAARMRINSESGAGLGSGVDFRGCLLLIWDGTRLIVGVVDIALFGLQANSGAKLLSATSRFDMTAYHVFEIHKATSNQVRGYVDGLPVLAAAYGNFDATATKAIWFGVANDAIQVNMDIDWIHYKVSTLLPASSPVATLHFDFGVNDTAWDLTTIKLVENLFGEAGNLKYKYGAGNSLNPSLNSTFLTAAQLAAGSGGEGGITITGRYMRLDVQFNGDGSQDAGFGTELEIAVTPPVRGHRARGLLTSGRMM